MKRFLCILLLLGVFALLSAQYLTESFEGTWEGTPLAPTGWTNINGAPASGTNQMWDKATWSGTAWTSTSGTYSTSSQPAGTPYGTAVAHYKDGLASSGQIDILRTPVVDLSSSTNPRIAFYYCFPQATLNVKVLASNDGFATTGVQIAALTSTSSATWTRFSVIIPATYKTTTAQLQIQITATYGSYDLWIDNVVIEEAPAPMAGTYTINPLLPGGSGNYQTFSAAVAAINDAGISAAVTFNVAADAVFTEEVPALTATGTSTFPIIFQKSGAGANPVVKPTTSSQGIKIAGGDYITFDGIDIMVASGQIPNYGYYLTAATATNGAQYNTIKNCLITLNKANTGTKGVYQYYGVTPTSIAGANSYNTYQNISVENSIQGLNLYGVSSTYPDLSNIVTGCTIGGATAGNMGGTGTGYGLYLYYQSGLQVYGNEIRNFASTSSVSVYGIYMATCYGENQIYKNKIHDLAVNYNSSSYYVYGMYLGMGSTGTNVAKAYNNMIWNLTHTLYTSTTSTYLVYGIYNGGATATNTYNIDFNTVRISGPTYGNSVCYYAAAVTAVNKVRNNVFANLTPTQTGTPYHYCYYSTSATVIGATGSVSNNNVLYVANEGQGFVGRGASTNFTFTTWASTMGESASRPTNPMFVDANNVHIQTGVPTPVEAKGSYFAGAITWVGTDIDAEARDASTPDIGADEGVFTLEAIATTPTAQPTSLVLIPAATQIDGSFTVASPAAEAYLVVRYTTVPPTAPVDGTSYSVGATMGDATAVVVKTGATTSFTTTGLVAATAYNFVVYSYNTSGIGAPKYYTTSPLTGSLTTLPAAPLNPATFTATSFSSTQTNLAATANAASSEILVAWNTTSTFGTLNSTTVYANGNAITGGGTVWYAGTAAGLTNHTSLIPGTTYYYKAWSYDLISGNYYNYSTGLASTPSSVTTPLPVNPGTFTATAVSTSQINLAATANAAGDEIMVAWNTVNTFGTLVAATNYAAGDDITGGGTVFYKGTVAGLTSHTGLPANAGRYYKVWSYQTYSGNFYYSTGLTANAATFMDGTSTQDFSGSFPPAGWSIYSGLLADPATLTSATGIWIQDDWLNVTTPVNKAASINIYGTGRNHWLRTSPIEMTPGNYMVNFNIGMTAYAGTGVPSLTGTDDKFVVLMGDGTSWSNANVLRKWDNAGSPYVYNSITNALTSVSIPITVTSGIKYLVFYGESTVSNADNDFFVDNLSFSTGTVVDLAASNLTVTPMYKFTDAPVTFAYKISNYGHTSSANVSLKANGVEFASVPTGSLASGGFVNLTADYAFPTAGTYTITAEVPADDNNTNNVATLANVVVYTDGQLVEGFEDVSFPPSRWLNWGDPLYTSWALGTTNGSQYDGAKYASLAIANIANTGANLATPKLVFEEGSTFGFYAKSSVAGMQIQMKISTSDDQSGTWTDLGSPITLTTAYAQYSYTVPVGGTTGNYRVSFNGLPNSLTGTLYLDQVVGPMIYNPPLPPGPVTLIAPLNEVVNVDPLTFTLDWAAPSTGGAPSDYLVLVTTNVEEFYDQVARNMFPATEMQLNSGADPIVLGYSTRYFWTVLPGNDSGYLDVADCPVYWFETQKQMSAPTTLALGNVFPSNPKSGTIAVTNLGPTTLDFTAAGTDFTFGTGLTIAPYSTLNLPYTFNGTATLGAYTGQITLTETSPTNGIISTLAVTANITSDIIIGNGTAELNIPVDPYFGYGYSQTIYYPSELNWPAGYRIEKVYYYFNGYETCEQTQTFSMYMGHTTASTFATTTSWVPLTSLTQVYNQTNTPQLASGGYWMEFTLSTPFIYNGVDNLVIAVKEGASLYDTSSSYFLCTNTTGINRSISYNNDSTNPNPAAPPTGTLKAGYPNTKIIVAPLPVNPVYTITPASKDFGTQFINTEATQTFTIRNNGGGTLAINTIEIAGDAGFTLMNLPTLPANLTMDQTTTFVVKYLPTAAGTHTATVTINDNLGREAHTVTVNGVCVDPTIYNVPSTQNFDSVTTPALPLGWAKITTGTYSNVTTGTSTPVSTPNNVYMYHSSSDTTPTVMLTSPLITPALPLNTLRVKFYARGGSTGYNLLVGTVNNQSAGAVFTQIASISPTTTNTQYDVSLAGYAGTDQYIAFKTGATPTYQTIYIDDVEISALPTEPMFLITPASRDFGQLLNTADVSQTFTIKNDGAGTMPINAITITGSSVFTLANVPTLPLNLTAGQTATFDVLFSTSELNTFAATVHVTDGIGAGTIHDVAIAGSVTDGSGGYKMATSFQTTAPSYPTYEWIDISTTGTEITGLTDDSFTAAIPLGFTFPFFGTNYTDVYVASNGYLALGTGTSAYSNVAIPSSGTPNNLIAWLWDDFNPADLNITSDWVKYQQINGTFVVTYYHLPQFIATTGATDWITAQVILYPTGKIKIQYNSQSGALLMTNTVGIENSTGSLGLQYRYSDGTTTTGGSIFGPAGEPMALAFGTDINGLGDGPATLDAPVVTITENPLGTIHLSWTAVAGATSYKVYTSTDPLTGWLPLTGNLAATTYDVVAPDAVNFYRVIATSTSPTASIAHSATVPFGINNPIRIFEDKQEKK